ncbi:MAG: hypothetical protein ACI94Y_003390 [Maribacter sp.]
MNAFIHYLPTFRIRACHSKGEAIKQIAFYYLIMAFGISFIVHMHSLEDQNFLHGAWHGVLMAGLFGFPAIAINYAYQRKSLKLFLIDAGYLLAFTALMGGVLAMLPLFVGAAQ